tara:strand:- start:8012 stop:10537 length:2526 start_codon:yes stop_codon:yes gene_type:complete
MPAITQLIPNFLGGVSRQNDDKKLLGQLTECVNGYPDATYGLLKRPGMKHLNNLKKANGDNFNKAELAGASWFFIERDAADSYVGCIKGADIFVWTTAEGTFCTVTNNAASYLTGTSQNDYHFRSIQDTTIITNKTVVTAMQASGTFVAKSTATLKLLALVNSYVYKVTIQGLVATATAQSNAIFNTFLTGNHATHDLFGAIKNLITTQQAASNADFNGTWYLESYSNSIVIRRTTLFNNLVTSGAAPTGTFKTFTIEAEGGPNNSALEVFQDEVTNVSKLPLQSRKNDHVKILNSDGPEDDYYVEFVAYNDIKGEGYWKEALARDVSPGLNAATMPHQLALTSATAFTFGPVTYNDRKAGDDETSPLPSFIDKTIQSSFFHSNRFGVLSEDNVIFGVANDTYNFFAKSALTQIDSDPIDLNVSSVKPVKLFEVQPTTQGLLLLSERQQFQVYAADGTILTPSSAFIRSLSNYEMAIDVQPVDVGTAYAFVSRVSDYSKLFSIELRDVEQSPSVIDISKAVLQWIPSTVDGLTVSPQNSVIMLVDRDTSYLYLYRYYNNGKEDLFQAWTKWELPGTIQTTDIINDSAFIISQHENEYTIGNIILDEIPSGSSVVGATSISGNTCLDMATRPVKPHPSVNAVVYDATNEVTKIYSPYTPFEEKEAIMLLCVPEADVGTPAAVDADAGFYLAAIERTEINTGYRYFEVQGDYTSYADGIVIGYNYDFEATLPKFYFRRDEKTTDYTATLTISRVTFSVGRTGPVLFKIKAGGSDEWKNVEYVNDANTYLADSSPVTSEHQFTIPIHQRNTNFELKVTSNFPYPVSLVSMMWEGNYSPRFYRRA